MKIIVKAKQKIKVIEEKDFLEMQQLFVRIMQKYNVQVEFRNFSVKGKNNEK